MRIDHESLLWRTSSWYYCSCSIQANPVYSPAFSVAAHLAPLMGGSSCAVSPALWLCFSHRATVHSSEVRSKRAENVRSAHSTFPSPRAVQQYCNLGRLLKKTTPVNGNAIDPSSGSISPLFPSPQALQQHCNNRPTTRTASSAVPPCHS